MCFIACARACGMCMHAHMDMDIGMDMDMDMMAYVCT